MNYDFPLINNIADVLPAIAGRDEIVVAERDGYTIINYTVAFADTFPEITLKSYQFHSSTEALESYHAAVRRECRGLVFDSKTGDILRRPYHKFFNVNEREETQDHTVNLSNPHVILEKLDGSMIAPFMNNGEIIWGTRMCAPDFHEAVAAFVEKHPNYISFATSCIISGYTPIFEWCSRKKRIVLDYGQEDQLILTAIRNNFNGMYMNRIDMAVNAQMDMIPIVRSFEPQSDMKAFLEYVHDLEDVEGFVVRFDDGHMLKLKCHWYVQIHKAKEKILQDRNIVELILEGNLDDVKAHLPTEDRDRLTQFESTINYDIARRVRLITQKLVYLAKNNIDRKTFAIDPSHSIGVDGFMRPIIFKNFGADNVNTDMFHSIQNDVHNAIRNNLGRTAKYEAIRDAWFKGVVYND